MLVVFAALADTFCLTGYFFYGAALAAAATTALSLGYPFWLVFLFCWIGATVGDVSNVFLARCFGTNTALEERLQRVLRHRILSGIVFRKEDKQLTRLFKILGFRFVAVGRPISGVLLELVVGAKPLDFLFYSAVNIIWVYFWLVLFNQVSTLIFF